jgi:hypothetical protein
MVLEFMGRFAGAERKGLKLAVAIIYLAEGDGQACGYK